MGVFFEPGSSQDFAVGDFFERGSTQDFAGETTTPFARLSFSSSNSGPYNFLVPYNPLIYEAVDKPSIEPFNTLHGSPIWQEEALDQRERVMTWRNNPLSDTKLQNMVTYIKSIEGKTRYVNFGVIDNLNNRWPNSNAWKNCRIIKVTERYRSGGKLKYADLNVFLRPA